MPAAARMRAVVVAGIPVAVDRRVAVVVPVVAHRARPHQARKLPVADSICNATSAPPRRGVLPRYEALPPCGPRPRCVRRPSRVNNR